MGRKVVIVGAGQVSATLVAKLRADGYDGGITVLGDENTLPYQRPPLSKAYLLGKQAMAQLHLRPAAFYSQAQIDLRLGCRAMAIEAGVRVVRLQGDEVVPYDHLVLATGSAARSWPAALGGTLEGVRTLRTFSDADSLSLAMRSARSILVIGGGYVGLELASAARTLGLPVTVVEAQKAFSTGWRVRTLPDTSVPCMWPTAPGSSKEWGSAASLVTAGSKEPNWRTAK